jgi:small subunit ribosomal protein S4
MKYTGPKAKRCRKHGVNIYGSDKYDKILQRKPYGPGKGPRTRPGRKSEYAQQLAEKQKARDIFGLSERQFKRLYDSAASSKEETGALFKKLLELRLDNAIYRAGFAMTRLQSRQFVSHGLFIVNGTRVTSSSYQLKEGDVITLRERSKNSPVFEPIFAAHEKYLPPSWLKVDSSAKQIEIVALPDDESTEKAIDMRQVIELYSRN